MTENEERKILPLDDEEILVPEDADENFDPGYVANMDESQGTEEIGPIPDDEVNDIG